MSEEAEVPRPDEKPGRPSSLVSLLLLVFLGAVGYNLYFVCQLKQVELEEKQAELRKVKTEIYLSEVHNKHLAAQVRHLKTDAGVEEIAREKLGLVSPGELAFVVVPPPPARGQKEEIPIPKTIAEPPTMFQRVLHEALLGKGRPATR